MTKRMAAVLAAGVLSISMAFAADEPAQGGRRPGGAGRPEGGAPGGRGGFDRGGMMGMSEEQMQAFREAMQKDGEKLRGLEEKLRAVQKELMEATLASDYSEQKVRAKAEALTKIQADMTVLRANALASVAAKMTAEEKQKLTESRFATMMLTGPGMGMMGGPGGAGPGGFRGRGPGGTEEAPAQAPRGNRRPAPEQ